MNRVGIGKRTLALLVDCIAFLPLALLGVFSLAGTQTTAACGLWVHPLGTLIVILCIWKWGQTPGMRLLRIKTVRIDGSSLGFTGAITRHAMDLGMSVSRVILLSMALYQLGAGLFDLLEYWTTRGTMLQSMILTTWRPALVVYMVWSVAGIITLLIYKRTLNDFVAGAVVVDTATASLNEASANSEYPTYINPTGEAHLRIRCILIMSYGLILVGVSGARDNEPSFKVCETALGVAAKQIKGYHRSHGVYPATSNDIPVPQEWWTLLNGRVTYIHTSAYYQLSVQLSPNSGITSSDKPYVASTNTFTIDGVTIHPGETMGDIRKKLPHLLKDQPGTP